MSSRNTVLSAIAVALVVFGVSCKQGDEFDEASTARAPDEPLATQGSNRPTGRDRSKGQVPPGHPPVSGEVEKGSTGGGSAADSPNTMPVDWETPSSWKSEEPSSDMRKAQYRIPGPEGGSAATLAVFHFPSGGGGVEQNIQRWSGQFKSDGGAAEPETEERTVRGLKVHTVELSGTYNPGVGMGAGEPKDDHMMLGAIVETGGGVVVFKMVGPAETVRDTTEAFDQFVSSLKPGG